MEAALAAADVVSGSLEVLDLPGLIGGRSKIVRTLDPMSWIRSAHEHYKPTREKLYKRLLENLASVRAEIRGIKGTRRPGKYRRGGAYRNLPAEGGERHHMPSDSASPLSRGSGPAIRMDTQDHRTTASWGPSGAGHPGGTFRSFKKTPFDEVPADFFDDIGVHVYYKEGEVCEAVEASSPSLPTFQNEPLLGRPFQEPRDWFVSMDADAEVDESGLTSHRLGIGLYAPSAAEDADEPAEAVIAFERGYYDEE